ncbi:hypothetical protein Busp01_09240 [Trinickia caryophylli]|nr:hypothetical protein Busp01_09240 [Trinickia caryophylli]
MAQTAAAASSRHAPSRTKREMRKSLERGKRIVSGSLRAIIVVVTVQSRLAKRRTPLLIEPR